MHTSAAVSSATVNPPQGTGESGCLAVAAAEEGVPVHRGRIADLEAGHSFKEERRGAA